ncbi:MAG: hypothetical protein UZ05_CHB002002498 [Chlorobi bacterium OLB5]|nr:MAG: hypothetical protein UZ05_CHB002002498 [Chlorobi bacterium OLB5]
MENQIITVEKEKSLNSNLDKISGIISIKKNIPIAQGIFLRKKYIINVLNSENFLS